MKSFARQVKDSGYNYRGIIQFIPYMVANRSARSTPSHETFASSASAVRQSAAGRCGKRRQESVVLLGVCQRGLCPSWHPLTLAQAAWISPSDLLHMREGDVATFKPETQLQYVGHLKLGVYLQAGKLVGLNKPKDGAE